MRDICFALRHGSLDVETTVSAPSDYISRNVVSYTLHLVRATRQPSRRRNVCVPSGFRYGQFDVEAWCHNYAIQFPLRDGPVDVETSARHPVCATPR